MNKYLLIATLFAWPVVSYAQSSTLSFGNITCNEHNTSSPPSATMTTSGNVTVSSNCTVSNYESPIFELTAQHLFIPEDPSTHTTCHFTFNLPSSIGPHGMDMDIYISLSPSGPWTPTSNPVSVTASRSDPGGIGKLYARLAGTVTFTTQEGAFNASGSITSQRVTGNGNCFARTL